MFWIWLLASRLILFVPYSKQAKTATVNDQAHRLSSKSLMLINQFLGTDNHKSSIISIICMIVCCRSSNSSICSITLPLMILSVTGFPLSLRPCPLNDPIKSSYQEEAQDQHYTKEYIDSTHGQNARIKGWQSAERSLRLRPKIKYPPLIGLDLELIGSNLSNAEFGYRLLVKE